MTDAVEKAVEAVQTLRALLSPEGEAKGEAQKEVDPNLVPIRPTTKFSTGTKFHGGFVDGNGVHVIPGDRVEYRFGGQGTVGEILHDGDADVTFDDGRFETVKWKNLCKVAQPPRDDDPVPGADLMKLATAVLNIAASTPKPLGLSKARMLAEQALDAVASAGITQGGTDV